MSSQLAALMGEGGIELGSTSHQSSRLNKSTELLCSLKGRCKAMTETSAFGPAAPAHQGRAHRINQVGKVL